MTIDPAVLYAGLGALLTAIAFGLRQWAVSWAYSNNARADGYTLQEKSQAEITSAIVDAVKQGNVFQQKMIQVVEENTRANEKGAAETRGMISMLDGFGAVLKNAVIGWDDAQGHIPIIRENAAQIPSIRDSVMEIRTVTATLETDIGETVGEQIGIQVRPIVDSLLSVETELKNLVVASRERDTHTNESLLQLVAGIVRAEFVPKDMTEKEARRFVFDLTLILLEGLKPGGFNRDDLSDKFVALLESTQPESEVQS